MTSASCDLNLINQYRMNKQHEEGIAGCTELLKRMPENSDLIFLLGELYVDSGLLDEAREQLNRLKNLQLVSKDAFRCALLLSHSISCKLQQLYKPAALPIEYPVYLYKNGGIFTALHPGYQHLRDYPPTRHRFRTNVRASVVSNYTESQSDQLAKNICSGNTHNLPLSFRRFCDAFISGCKSKDLNHSDVVKFLATRPLRESLTVPESAQHLFLGTYPIYFGHQKWSVMIESIHTLFYPFAAPDAEGSTYYFDYNKETNPLIKIVETLLSLDNCTAVISHLKSTHRMLSNLFDFPGLEKKFRYMPIGWPVSETQMRKIDEYSTINFLFINSHGAHAGQFVNRGGLEVVNAFMQASEYIKNISLTICGAVPWEQLDPSEKQFLENSSCVTLKESYLTEREMISMFQQSHVFLIPSYSLHSMSTVQALSYGLPVVVSDGWGFDEFVSDGRNGFVASGQAKHSYVDQAGFSRFDFRRTYRLNEKLIESIRGIVTKLVNNPEMLRKMAEFVLVDARQRFSIFRRNELLADVFDA